MQTYLNGNCFRERIFRLRVNEETFNVNQFILVLLLLDRSLFQDMTMVRISCLSTNDIDYVDYGHRLLSNLSNQF